MWRWLAYRIVPPWTLAMVPAVRYRGDGPLLRRLLDTGALT